MPDKRVFSEWLKTYIRQDESHRAFLIRIGFPNHYSWLRAENAPTPSNIIQLSGVLGVSEGVVLRGAGLGEFDSVQQLITARKHNRAQQIRVANSRKRKRVPMDLRKCVVLFLRHQYRKSESAEARMRRLTKQAEYNRRRVSPTIRVIAKARRLLSRINLRLDEIEKGIAKETTHATAYITRMQREKIKDRFRKAQRRRIDPSTGRVHERNKGLWITLLKEFDYRCAYCAKHQNEARKDGFNLQVDHIVPISSGQGFTGRMNLAIACISCNASKCNRDLIDWLVLKDGIDPHPLVISRYQSLACIYAA